MKFRPEPQNLLGIAIIHPNVRGSTGFGKTFVALDDGFKREDSVRDIGAIIDFIKKDPNLDASRIAVAGGSYGGYTSPDSGIEYNLLRGILIAGEARRAHIRGDL